MKLTPAVQKTLAELRNQGIDNPSSYTIAIVARSIGEHLTDHEITQVLYITRIPKKPD
jgi:hypothetical protein